MENIMFKMPMKTSLEIRKTNIQHIFTRTIYKMDEITSTYDYCFSRLCSFDMLNNYKSHDYFELHERVLKLTLKLLSK
jgi:hypothetical protein